MATIGDSAGEVREDIPLKQGSKSSGWCSCDEETFGGSRFINISFAVLSVVITVALLVQIYYGDYQVAPHGSVATDSRECSSIGTSALKSGGNAIDAVIASTLCLAVVNPHVTGLDASGQMILYNHRTREPPISIDFSTLNHEITLFPRLLIGLAYIHKKYSKLPWKKLVQPSADLAKTGFLVSRTLTSSFLNYQGPKDWFSGSLEAGNKLILNSLGDYLTTIGSIEEKDLYKYVSNINEPLQSSAVISKFKNYNIIMPGSSVIGTTLLLNLQQIDHLNFTTGDVAKPIYVSTMAQITKMAYAKLNAMEKYYEGTSSNVAVMDLDDFYVSVVTGMSRPFGSGNLTPGGYFTDANYSEKLSQIPLIITDSNFICGRRIVLGVSDIVVGSQVITALLLNAENATISVEAPRFHILQNGAIGVEDGHTPSYSVDVVNKLNLTNGGVEHIKEPYDSCNIVEKFGDVLNSHSDSRGGGIASRF
ncbi:glutathione hydrolase 7-like isoform X2 [Photinus pyralis]|uniref:glutathione hydrolase 7-like isoform X2 n=1 Tax=Photinus pyralis TaxID=7054 RepID=UPI0012671755|nr:glutathione hydrolase 7-like isoform X2 [Photinus pyralis]